MFSWFPKRQYDNINSALKYVYKKKLLPMEKMSLYNIHSPEIDEKLFDAKPTILLFGQYSTGKTTLIKHLIGRDYPGCWIGPEPTTDRFMAVMSKEGTRRDVIPGNALVMDRKFPYHGLSKYGGGFLSRFQASFVHSPFLRDLTIIDTPGVLSGEKQGLKRGYDFPNVLRWFADNADRIILIFDAHKLDIPDELKSCIESLSNHKEKVLILLNKADMVDHHHLIKVYGSLMWSLGKIIPTPEVSKVYIGSFWDEPIKQEIYKELFENEKAKLFEDLQSVAENNYMRKMNDLIKRANLVKAHAHVMSYFYHEVPSYFGKERKQRQLIENLPAIYENIQNKYYLNPEDFPCVMKMQRLLTGLDFSKLRKIKQSYFRTVDEFLTEDVKKLMTLVDEGDSEYYINQQENYNNQPENFYNEPENFSNQPENFRNQPEDVERSYPWGPHRGIRYNPGTQRFV